MTETPGRALPVWNLGVEFCKMQIGPIILLGNPLPDAPRRARSRVRLPARGWERKKSGSGFPRRIRRVGHLIRRPDGRPDASASRFPSFPSRPNLHFAKLHLGSSSVWNLEFLQQIMPIGRVVTRAETPRTPVPVLIDQLLDLPPKVFIDWILRHGRSPCLRPEPDKHQARVFHAAKSVRTGLESRVKLRSTTSLNLFLASCNGPM